MKKLSKIKPIPPFKSLEEEAEFWDTHDLSPLFNNPRTPLSTLPLLETAKEEILTIRVERWVKNKIKRVARTHGINPTTLARMWLIEKLRTLRL